MPGCEGYAFDATQACIIAGLEARRLPADLYLMLDRSASMITNCIGGGAPPCTTMTRWDAIVGGMDQFVQSASADSRVGLQFFGASGLQDDAIDCDVSRYSTPAVEIAPMALAGPSITAAVDSTLPGGLTPMLPALQGALDHAKAWAMVNPDRPTAAVLITDGYPTQCGTSVADVAAVAQQAYVTSPSIRTHVVTLAADLNLGSIALQGGTDRAISVDESDAEQALAGALLSISTQSSCRFLMPFIEVPVDPRRVQLVHTPPGGERAEVPYVSTAASCSNSGGGWYFDDEASPGEIVVCPCTCRALAESWVEVYLGCEPRSVGAEAD